jgi:hypothetical protein
MVRCSFGPKSLHAFPRVLINGLHACRANIKAHARL